jgi:hypothetical protein
MLGNFFGRLKELMLVTEFSTILWEIPMFVTVFRNTLENRYSKEPQAARPGVLGGFTLPCAYSIGPLAVLPLPTQGG